MLSFLHLVLFSLYDSIVFHIIGVYQGVTIGNQKTFQNLAGVILTRLIYMSAKNEANTKS